MVMSKANQHLILNPIVKVALEGDASQNHYWEYVQPICYLIGALSASNY